MFGFVFKEHQHDNGPIHDACGMTAASKIGAVIQLQSGIKLELTQPN